MSNEDFLRRYNIKVTKSRIAILKIFIESDNSLSADEIYDECRRIKESINLSTIYRTLELYYEKNIISKFNLCQGKDVYRLRKESHKHIIECSICNEEIEIPCPMEQIEETLQSEIGFTLTEHSLSIKGICSKCKEGK